MPTEVKVIDQVWSAYKTEFEYWVKKLGLKTIPKLTLKEYIEDELKHSFVMIVSSEEVFVGLNPKYNWTIDNGDLNEGEAAYRGQHLAVQLKLMEWDVHKYFSAKQFEGVIENCLSFVYNQEDFMTVEMIDEYIQNFIPNNK